MLPGKLFLSFAFIMGTIGFGISARAAFVFHLTQLGGDVIATGSGTLNLTALISAGPTTDAGFVDPSLGLLGVGPTATSPVTFYSGLTGPSSFGSGGSENSDSGSGSEVIIAGVYEELAVPVGYTSGTLLNDSATFYGSYASLGITPGIYTWSWGTGPSADSLTITTIPVPEPVSLATLCVAPAFILLRRRRAGALVKTAPDDE